MPDPSIPEKATRVGAALDDYQLDATLAEAAARRDVAAAHGYEESATGWNEVCIALADLRKLRHDFATAVNVMTYPEDMG